MRRWWVRPSRAVALVAATGVLYTAMAATAASCRSAANAQTRSVRPNLLFVLTDDQRWDTMDVMPVTRAAFDVEFRNAVATTPLCCPSRASILTGQYAGRTGVRTNADYPVFAGRDADSLGPWLEARGYHTGFVGKYFNRFSVEAPVPPGWDEFYGLAHDLSDEPIHTGIVLRERWNDGGILRNELVEYPPGTPTTPLYADRAVRFIDRAEDPSINPDGAPWALFVWTSAPHEPFPEPRHADASVPPWTPPPSFLEADRSDKPEEVRGGPNRVEYAATHQLHRDTALRELMGVDDLVGRLFDRIDAHDARERTWGLYASDNGTLWGEHGLSRKLYAYEESIRIPLRAAVPGGGPRTVDALVANIDLAPTIAELAGDQGPHDFDGRSLVGLATGSAPRWRDAVAIENWAAVCYVGVRGTRWKYVRWVGSGHEELYDLAADPYELVNVAGARPAVVERMRAELAGMRADAS